MDKLTVVISVQGGVAQLESCPQNITVAILDYDVEDHDESTFPLCHCQGEQHRHVHSYERMKEE